MSFVRNVARRLLSRTEASKVYTFPGSPPTPVYDVVSESDAELVQGVREQHLLHLAQSHYYDRLEQGDSEVPLVVASAELGEAMLSQGLLAGSISCPCVVLVVEERFPHVQRAATIAHQSDRGETYDLVEDTDVLSRHENVAGRVRVVDEDDVGEMEALVERAVDEQDVAVIHLPRYADEGVGDEYAECVEPMPETVDVETLGARWAAAERPMLLVGRGAKGPERLERVEQVAADSGAVVASTLQVDGLVEENYVGRIGTIGTPSANQAFFEADCVVAVGTSLNNLLTSYDPENILEFRSKTLQVEESPRRRTPFVDAWVDGGVDASLDVLEGGGGSEVWFDGGVDLGGRQAMVPERVRVVGEAIAEERSEAVVTLGVGNSMVWMTYALGPDVRKETSRKGSMGEYVAGLEWGDDPVLVVGDGEFEMDVSALVEAQYQDVAATVFVVNNSRLGMVTEGQEAEYGDRLTPKVTRPIEYGKLGEAFEGVASYAPTSVDEVASAAREALQSDRISVVEVPVEATMADDLYDIFDLPTGE